MDSRAVCHRCLPLRMSSIPTCLTSLETIKRLKHSTSGSAGWYLDLIRTADVHKLSLCQQFIPTSILHMAPRPPEGTALFSSALVLFIHEYSTSNICFRQELSLRLLWLIWCSGRVGPVQVSSSVQSICANFRSCSFCAPDSFNLKQSCKVSCISRSDWIGVPPFVTGC